MKEAAKILTKSWIFFLSAVLDRDPPGSDSETGLPVLALSLPLFLAVVFGAMAVFRDSPAFAMAAIGCLVVSVAERGVTVLVAKVLKPGDPK